jgi:hypothetical protein
MDAQLHQAGIAVRILAGPYLEDGRPTPAAIEFYTGLVNGLDQLRDFAASKLLALYNDNWLDETNGRVDLPQFKARLTNPSICLYDEIGGAVVNFEDGGLFAGHWIEIHFEDGVPTHAGIIG